MLKDQIFKASVPKLTPVALQGVTVYVRSLTGRELGMVHHQTETLKAQGKDPSEVNVNAVLWATCDQDGNRVFGQEDAEAVAGLPWQAFQQLVQAVLKASGLDADSLQDAKNA
jgi:hypothetical protein